MLTTILDEIMSWAAIRLLQRIALTQRIEVEFLKPVQVGMELQAEGRVRAPGVKNDALTEGVLYDAEGEACARATAVFKVFSPAVARRLGIADEASIRWFERIFQTVGEWHRGLKFRPRDRMQRCRGSTDQPHSPTETSTTIWNRSRSAKSARTGLKRAGRTTAWWASATATRPCPS